MTDKPHDQLTISDLAAMGHALTNEAGKMPYLSFGGFSNGKEAMKQLKRIENLLEDYRVAIRAVAKNRRRSVEQEQRAEFNYLAKELGKRVRA